MSANAFTKFEITKRSVEASLGGHVYLVPAGTKVGFIERASGGAGAWAVASEAVVAAITQNPHDAKYRYLFVPDNAVDDWVDGAAIKNA